MRRKHKPIRALASDRVDVQPSASSSGKKELMCPYMRDTLSYVKEFTVS